MVIFVKFSDDNYDVSPDTDLWPHDLVGLPSWAPGIISSSVQPSYFNPSISGYFDEMSLSQFQLIGNVYGLLYIPLHEESYYYKSSGRNISYLTEEILTQLNPYINYAQYDNLSPGGTTPDGVVDMIFICFRFFHSDNLDNYHYTGYASLTGSYPTFGSGSSSLTLDGKQINAGFPGSGTIQSGVLCLHAIGVIVHEYGHYLFGSGHFTGIGYWGLMDGSAPGPACAFERAKLSWITPNLISSNQMNVCLHDAITEGDIKKVEVTPGSSYYFLTENRQRLSYYESNWLQYNGGPLRVPGTGLLITHVTSTSAIDIECADKKWDWQKSGSNYVYPFVKLNPNPFTGLDEMELRNVSTTDGIKSHPDFRGDADDTYKLGSYTMFSPWSNPNSNSVGGYGPKYFSDKSIILKSMNGSDMYLDYFTTLANNTFSASSEATAFNSQRKLLRTSDGRLHLVFESEGEIFYRRTQTDGTTWENSTSVYLSTGNYNNKYPSSTGTSAKQFVVWQRYTGYSGGQYKYDTYFARNTGSGWTTTTITNLSNLGFYTQTDPLPVVTYKNPSGTQRLLVCVRSNTGIRYCYSDNDGSTWSATGNLPSTTSDAKTPSLSMGPTTPSSTVYATYDQEGGILYNTYNTSWGTVENVSNGAGCTENINASVEVDGNSGKNVAWEGRKLSNNKCVIVHKRKTSSWGAPTYFEPGSGCEFHRPSITGLAGIKRAIVWHDNYGSIYRAYTSDGYNWSTFTLSDGWLQHPDLSAGTTTAKYVFTGGSASPYQIYLSSETLPLGSLDKSMLALAEEEHLKMLPCPQHYHRVAVIEDTTRSSLLWAQWGEITVSTQKSEEIPLTFITWEDSSSKITPETAFDYLTTNPIQLPQNCDSMKWEQEFYGADLQKLITPGASQVVIEVQMVAAKTGALLAILNRSTFSVSAAESRVAGTVTTDISAFQGQEVVFKVYPMGLANNGANVTSNIGDVFIIENPFLGISQPKAWPPVAAEAPLPLTFTLEQNYPNPFNSATEIKYQLPQAAQVTLKIYNLLGQEVRTLVDQDKDVGYHAIRWDGKDVAGQDLASGIYVYRIKVGTFVASKKLVLIR